MSLLMPEFFLVFALLVHGRNPVVLTSGSSNLHGKELSGINRSITYATGLATGIGRHFQINEYGLLHLGYFIHLL